MRLQLRFQPFVVIVAISALALMLHTWLCSHYRAVTWWDCKPFLNLMYFPLVTFVLLQSKPSRWLVASVISVDLLLLFLWLELGRPSPPLVVGPWDSHPIDVIINCYYSSYVNK